MDLVPALGLRVKFAPIGVSAALFLSLVRVSRASTEEPSALRVSVIFFRQTDDREIAGFLLFSVS